METVLQRCAGNQLFEGISENDLRHLLPLIKIESHVCRDTIIREGDTGSSLFLIIDGTVSISKIQKNKSLLILGQRGSGDYFGEMALINNAPRSASVTAESSCTLGRIDQNDFDRMIYEQPGIAVNILKTISLRLRDTTRQIGIMTAVMDSMAEGVIAADRDGLIIEYNSAAEQMLSMKLTGLTIKTWASHVNLFSSDMITPFPFENLPLLKAVQGETSDQSILYITHTSWPAGKWLSMNGRPVKNADGEVIGGVVVFRDITRIKADEAALKKNLSDLQHAMSQIKQLSGLLPICANCKKIRDDKGYWHQIENYIVSHSEADFSHGICKECAMKLYPELYKDGE